MVLKIQSQRPTLLPEGVSYSRQAHFPFPADQKQLFSSMHKENLSSHANSFIALACWFLITTGSFLGFASLQTSLHVSDWVKNTTFEPNKDLQCSLHLRVTLTSLGLQCCRRHEQETFSNCWLRSLLIILMGRETPEDGDNQRTSSLSVSFLNVLSQHKSPSGAWTHFTSF